MIVLGQVTSIRELEPRVNEQTGEVSNLHNVSIEGFSLLAGDGAPLPVEGQFVKAEVAVNWKKGKRPVHFLRHWSLPTFQ